MAQTGTKLNEFLHWKWENETTPHPLQAFAIAPEALGLYELGEIVDDVFVPKYVGRAAGGSWAASSAERCRPPSAHTPRPSRRRAILALA